MPKRDINQIAASIVKKTTESYSQADSGKNPAAVALGKLGGAKGGPARAKKLSSARRKAIARKAAKKRWSKVRRSGR
jgi:hypothetical protein